MSTPTSLQTNENEIPSKMGWSDLPKDLLLLILKTLNPNLADQIRLSCVCPNWRPALLSLPLSPPNNLPWLLLPSTSTSTIGNHFYSCSEDRIHSFPASVSKTTLIFGSHSGWLLAIKTQRQNKFIFSLKNPFTGAAIRLPCPKPNCPLSDVQSSGVAIVWDRSETAVLVACRGRRGVFYCHLDSTTLSWKQVLSIQIGIAHTITCYKNKFHIYNAVSGETIVLSGKTLKENPENDNPVVGSFEDSLLSLHTDHYLHSFDFYNDLHELVLKDMLWEDIESIGNRAIFLDDHHCFAVEVDERSKFKKNCVYIARSKREGPSIVYTVFVFNLKSWKRGRMGTALSKFRVPAPPRGEVCVCPATWILPSLDY